MRRSDSDSPTPDESDPPDEADGTAPDDTGESPPDDGDTTGSQNGGAPSEYTQRFERLSQTTRHVLGIVAVGFLVRFALLGARVAHFDEGRVGWWALHFLDSGQFEYRYIIHGPLVQHVNKFVFAAIGPNDFSLRLFVAVVGALLPLSALLFREHLNSDEVVGVAFFLALSPLLVYYSRFFRSTLLAAAFAFVAFGLVVRAYDEWEVRYVHAAVAFIALAFTAKENAAVYLLVWVGATALLVDHLLFRTGGEDSGVDWVIEKWHDSDIPPKEDLFFGALWHVVVGLVIFCGITLYFYAPREPNAAAVGFWQAITNPTLFPEMVGRTIDDVIEGYSYWFGGTTDAGCRKENVIDAYLCFLGQELQAIGQSALALTAMAVVGFVAERYGRANARNVVLFTAYWGFVSILGYPLGTDIANAWIAVNALVPLALPAGVGIALVWGRMRDSLHTGSVRFGITVFVLLLIGGYMAVSMGTSVYTNPTSEENELVQYAQPADDFRPAMSVLDDHAASHDGTDVLIVGSTYVRDSPRAGGITPLCTSISDVLPLQWYIEAYDAEGDCIADPQNASLSLQRGSVDPLVVIAPSSQEDQLAPALPGYESAVHGLRTYGSEAVFFYDQTPERDRRNVNTTALRPAGR